ncbi:hypothetical protein ACHAWF_005642, partial [Thalassiosira exigua]
IRISVYWAIAAGLLLDGGTSPRFVEASVDRAQHRSFADELTAILYRKDNECTSALGVSMAFSLIYPGSNGNGTEEIRDTLGYPEGSNMQLVWNETTLRMSTDSDGRCAVEGWDGGCNKYAPLLQIANSVWLDNGDALNADYELVVGSYAKQIDFQANDSAAIVNDWVHNSTNGLIDSIVDGPLYPYKMIAINSIYLKASWQDQFSRSKTNLDIFYASTSKDDASKAHFMNAVFDFVPYSHDALPGYQIVQLGFAVSQMSMIFVLLTNGDSREISSAELIPALENLQSTRLALSMPKFKFESKYEDDLKEAIKQTGIVAPFGGGSLCGLLDVGSCGLFISKVIQKTVVEVNEEGVEAAAVTAIFMRESAAPELDDPTLMIIDHPFQFFIYDEMEDVVLFEGRVGAPDVPEAPPDEPALLTGVRSDSDFWLKNFGVDPVEPSLDMNGTIATNSTTRPDASSGNTLTTALLKWIIWGSALVRYGFGRNGG